MEQITNTAFKYAFYPSKSQERMLNRWFAGCRVLRNKLLTDNENEYQDWLALPEDKRGLKPSPTFANMCRKITILKSLPGYE